MQTNNVSAKECKERIEKIKNSVKGTWTQEEDEKIIRYYQKFGRNWALIAKKIEGRNGK
jgi:hypothetical protein